MNRKSLTVIGLQVAFLVVSFSCTVVAQTANSGLMVTGENQLLEASDRSIETPVPGAEATAADASNPPSSSNQDDWVHRWLRTVDSTRASQPHDPAPLITTHVLLVQQFRYDMDWRRTSTGALTSNYGSGRGLEIIPNSRMEIQVGLPSYVVHQGNIADGFADVSMFFKFRAFSAPEGRGNYFVGVFMGASFPSGSSPNGMLHAVLSPMLAASKGWRGFEVQSTLNGTLPTSGTNILGRSIVFNNAFQYDIRNIWPEMEINSTFFTDGPNRGKNQVFLTPGILFGNFKIAERLHLKFGAGVQTAATQFRTYNHRWIFSVRMPF